MKTLSRFIAVLALLHGGVVMAATKTITVTWTVNDDSNIQQYRLYYDTESTMANKTLVPNCAAPVEDPANTFTMSCSDVSLEGQSVYFSIAAVEDGTEYFSPSFEKQVSAMISPVQDFRMVIGDSQPSGTVGAAINFQPENADIPEGFTADSGSAFSSARGYGWTAPPASVGTRDRNNATSANQEDDTFIHVGPAGIWEYSLPNGTYSVTVRVGDPTAPDTQNTVIVEGVPVLQNAAISHETPWVSGSGTVTVQDGRLTLAFTGSSPYAKLCWITIN